MAENHGREVPEKSAPAEGDGSRPRDRLGTSGRRWGFLAFCATVGAGLVARGMFALSGRPLWLDPAMLALNIVRRDALGLLQPLDMAQAAPPGVLLVMRLVLVLAGGRLGALVVVPLLAGCAALIAMAVAAWRALDPRDAVLVIAPLALGVTGVYFSGEVKQYSSELLVTSLVMLAAVQLSREGSPTAAGTRWLVVAVALLGPVAGFTGAMSIPVLLAAMAVRGLAARPPRRRDVLLPVALLVGCLSAYGALLHHLRSPALVGYHGAGFPPEGLGAGIAWWGDRLVGFFSYPLNVDPVFIVPVLLLLIGAAAPDRLAPAGLWRLVAVGVGFATVASAQLHLYPFYSGEHDVNSRFVVHLVPPALLLCGRGLAVLRGIDRRSIVWAVAALAWCGAVVVHRIQAREYLWQDVPSAVRYVAGHSKPSDCLWVYAAAVPQVEIATLGSPLSFTPGTAQSGASVPQFVEDLTRVRRCDNVWLIVSHDFAGEATRIVEAAQQLGFGTQVKRFRGARVIHGERGLGSARPRSDSDP